MTLLFDIILPLLAILVYPALAAAIVIWLSKGTDHKL